LPSRTALTLAFAVASLVLLGAAPGLGARPRVSPAASSSSCSASISGPNDPDYAPGERNPLIGGTFNAEQWPLFDCIPQSTPAARDPEGAAGMSVNKAWQSFGRGNPGVTVAYMEGGINWRQADSKDLRLKAFLNTGELPWPQDSSRHTHGTYDLDGDRVVTVDDYKDDPRVKRPFLHQDTAGGITSEDLIAAFGHCRVVNHQLDSCPPNGSFDNDHNGYPNDISGWNFHRDTNDPQTDQSVYDHANDQSSKLAAEADNNFGRTGLCPNCRLLSVKLGDEAIDRPDRVAEGVVYAVDAGAKVLDVTTAALGQTPSMRAAVEYAYRHGVTIAWASNDFDSADHTEGMRFAHVWPGNSLVADQSNRQGQNPGPGRSQPNDVTTTTFRSRSTLTSYGAHALFSVPSPDGSTSAGTPTTAGVAALVTSAGLDTVAQHQLASPLDANEVFQVTRATASPIAYTPCPTCFPGEPGAEWNIQYGYGRPNVFSAMKAVHDGEIPPTADIVAPDWYRQIDRALTKTLPITVAAAAKRSPSYHWEIQYGLGPQPTDGQFRTIATGGGNGPQQITRNLDLSQIPRQFSDGSYQAPTADRLSIERYDVTVRVRVTDVHGRLGEDRRVFQLRHDPSEIAALHKDLGTSIESQPTLADIEGRGSLDTIVAGSDGTIHAYRPDGSEAPGWPVRTLPARGVDPAFAPNYLQSPAWSSGELPLPREPIVAPLAVGDLDHNGSLSVIASGEDGHFYVWDGRGRLRQGFPVETDRRYARQAVPVPDTPYVRNRSTGSLGGVALADLEGNKKLDIVAGGWDGQVYAWQPDGKQVPGWPVSTDTPAAAHHPPGTDIYARDYKIATTPTIVDIDGDGHPDVVVALQDTAFGTNGAPTYGFVVAYSSQGNRRAGGALLPRYPVTLPAAVQAYGSAQDFIIEGVQTPAAYDTLHGPQLVANPGLYFSQTVDLRSGQMHQETPATLPADGPVNSASPLVHFTTTPAIGKIGANASVLAVQSGSALNDVATGVVATPGRGIRVRSAVAAWDPETGANRPQYTQPIQGLGFLSAPALADVSGDGKADIVQGGDSGALHAFDGTTGQPVPGWPKWTGGWPLFTPAVGDIYGNGKVEVVAGLREGYLRVYATPGLASANDQAWHWHQNDRDTGHYGDDTRPPAAVRDLRVQRAGSRDVLTFTAPGDDWNTGRAAAYQVFAAPQPITQDTVDSARPVAVGLQPGPAGASQQLSVQHQAGLEFYAVRAIDHAGNIGPLPLAFDVGPPDPLPPGGQTLTSCRSLRRLVIHPYHPRGTRVLSAVVLVNGHRLRSLRAHGARASIHRIVVSLRGRPRSTVRVLVKMRVQGHDGRVHTVRDRRTYHTCIKRLPRPHRGHRHTHHHRRAA